VKKQQSESNPNDSLSTDKGAAAGQGLQDNDNGALSDSQGKGGQRKEVSKVKTLVFSLSKPTEHTSEREQDIRNTIIITLKKAISETFH